MEFWLNEVHTEGYSVNWKFVETKHAEHTGYQHLAVIDTLEFGRALVLDGIIQTTEKDEFIYHEMMVHPALSIHPNPQKILVIGGGDGGTIRETVKYSSIQEAHLVEIDEKVIWASRQYLPQISKGLGDPRVKIFVEDGLKFIKERMNYYDIVLVDSSDPIGPAVGLYSSEFFTDIKRALKDDGIVVAQTGSPIFNKENLIQVNKSIAKLFPVTRTYLTAIASYIGGFWTFTLGSNKYDPMLEAPKTEMIDEHNLKYYNEEIHRACFALPNFLKELLKK